MLKSKYQILRLNQMPEKNTTEQIPEKQSKRKYVIHKQSEQITPKKDDIGHKKFRSDSGILKDQKIPDFSEERQGQKVKSGKMIKQKVKFNLKSMRRFFDSYKMDILGHQ
jgi:hypothetical protein